MEKHIKEHRLQKMISILNQMPIGLVEIDTVGFVLQINAKGLYLLKPIFSALKLSGNNIYELFNIVAPEIVKRIHRFQHPAGSIISQENFKIDIPIKNQLIVKYFYFDINKLDQNTYTITFDDITSIIEKDEQISKAKDEIAIDEGKVEIASGILHDIGNAVVGFSSYINRIKRHLIHSDRNNLHFLHEFLEKNKQQFDLAIGEAKSKAMIDLIAGIVENKKQNEEHVNAIINEQMAILTHISDILSIQRLYLKGGGSPQRERVNIRSVINDSIEIIIPLITQFKIDIKEDVPINIPTINGDKTRLIQVFLNLIKNAIESIVTSKNLSRSISIQVVKDNESLIINITDNGGGFDNEIAKKLFSPGFSTKSTGSGLGLSNCKSIIESHDGKLELKSEGIGKGASVILTLNIRI